MSESTHLLPVHLRARPLPLVFPDRSLPQSRGFNQRITQGWGGCSCGDDRVCHQIHFCSYLGYTFPKSVLTSFGMKRAGNRGISNWRTRSISFWWPRHCSGRKLCQWIGSGFIGCDIFGDESTSYAGTGNEWKNV